METEEGEYREILGGKFQKDLIVWKRINSGKGRGSREKVSEGLNSVETFVPSQHLTGGGVSFRRT